MHIVGSLAYARRMHRALDASDGGHKSGNALCLSSTGECTVLKRQCRLSAMDVIGRCCRGVRQLTSRSIRASEVAVQSLAVRESVQRRCRRACGGRLAEWALGGSLRDVCMSQCQSMPPDSNTRWLTASPGTSGDPSSRNDCRRGQLERSASGAGPADAITVPVGACRCTGNWSGNQVAGGTCPLLDW